MFVLKNCLFIQHPHIFTGRQISDVTFAGDFKILTCYNWLWLGNILAL